jgi:hypothetical protein
VKTLISPLALLLVAGCVWPVVTVRAPSAKGTWAGVTEPVTLYNKEGKEYQATGLMLRAGPVMKDQDGREYYSNESAPILLDEDGHPFQLPAGQTFEVSGKMHPALRPLVPGLQDLGTKPGQSTVWAIQVHGEPKQLR